LDKTTKKNKAIMDKKQILFLCAHNSARSQMAEAFLRLFFGDRYDVWSAGIKPSCVNPYVISVMDEEGVDMTGHYAKNVSDYIDYQFDSVVTVCDNVHRSCPFFPGAKNYIHEGFIDPSLFQGTEEDMIRQFRKVRDDIKYWIMQTFLPDERWTSEGLWEG
jgi:arsenate reductase